MCGILAVILASQSADAAAEIHQVRRARPNLFSASGVSIQPTDSRRHFTTCNIEAKMHVALRPALRAARSSNAKAMAWLRKSFKRAEELQICLVTWG